MKRATLCIFTFLFVVAMGLAVTSVQRCFACNAGSSVVGFNRTPLTSTADLAGKFSATLRLAWAFVDVPFIGAVELAPGSVNIQGSPTYTPAYFFPSSCLGGIDIVASGKLTNARVNGLMQTKGWVWDSSGPNGYAEHEHSLTVLHR